MRKFIKLILVNLSLFLLLNIIIFLHYKQSLYSYNYPDHKNLKTYMFGDSHGKALNKSHINLPFNNYSISSDSYGDINNRITLLLNQNVKLDTVIIPVDAHTLSTYRDQKNNLMYSEYFDSNFMKYLPTFNTAYITSLIPKFTYHIGNHFYPSIPNDLNWVNTTDKSIRIAERFTSQFENEKFSEKQYNSLLNIISICEYHDILLLGIKFPICSDYFLITEDFDFHADSVFINRNIPLFDLSQSLTSDSLFYDQDHVNSMGADRTLLNIKKELNSIALESNKTKHQ